MDYQDKLFATELHNNTFDLKKMRSLRGKSCAYGGIDFFACTAFCDRMTWLESAVARGEDIVRKHGPVAMDCGCFVTEHGRDWNPTCTIHGHQPDWRTRAEEAETEIGNLLFQIDKLQAEVNSLMKDRQQCESA